MHRIDDLDAAVALPAPRPLGAPGFFQPGNVNTGQEATIVQFDWCNTIQEELMNIILSAGEAPDKTDNTQVLQALSILLGGYYLGYPTPWAPDLPTSTTDLLVPLWAKRIQFEMVGAGGGGGYCERTAANPNNYAFGAGGGSSGYGEAMRFVTPGSLVNVTIGRGGFDNPANEVDRNGITCTINAPTFPQACTILGGGGAYWQDPVNSAGGGVGVATGFDLNVNGSYGSDGQAGNVAGEILIVGGAGATGPWGGAGRSGDGGGLAAGGPGAGGGGSYDSGATGARIPGARGAGGLLRYRFLP